MPQRPRAIGAGLAVFAVGIAAGASGSTFSSYSATTSNGDATANSFSAATDFMPPTVTASTIGKATGGTPAGGRPGAVKTGSTIYVYANVTDTGNPATGVKTVTADLSNVISGQSAVALSSSGGPWTVDGTTYAYRAAPTQTVTATGNSALNYTVTTTDNASNSSQPAPYQVIVDNIAPTASDVQITNKAGGIAGKAEQGDTITLTSSDATGIDPYSVIPSTAWNGTSTNVTVRLNNASPDNVQIYNAANTTLLNLGTISLGSTGYTGANRTFTSSTMVQSGSQIVITLGTPSGGVNTVSTSTTAKWTPSTSAFDIAGNAMNATAANEQGAADAEF